MTALFITVIKISSARVPLRASGAACLVAATLGAASRGVRCALGNASHQMRRNFRKLRHNESAMRYVTGCCVKTGGAVRCVPALFCEQQ